MGRRFGPTKRECHLDHACVSSRIRRVADSAAVRERVPARRLDPDIDRERLRLSDVDVVQAALRHPTRILAAAGCRSLESAFRRHQSTGHDDSRCIFGTCVADADGVADELLRDDQAFRIDAQVRLVPRGRGRRRRPARSGAARSAPRPRSCT